MSDPIPENTFYQTVAMFKAGVAINEIAAKLGISQSTVQRYRTRAGLPSRSKKRRTPRTRSAARRLDREEGFVEYIQEEARKVREVGWIQRFPDGSPPIFHPPWSEKGGRVGLTTPDLEDADDTPIPVGRLQPLGLDCNLALMKAIYRKTRNVNS